MPDPKLTPEQIMQAVLAFARKQLAAGNSADKVHAMLVSKGLTPAAASKVMAKLDGLQRTGSTSRTVSGKGVPPSQTAPVDNIRRFAIQGRFLCLPDAQDQCALPVVCVTCGTNHPAEAATRTEKHTTYGINPLAQVMLPLPAVVLTSLWFVPELKYAAILTIASLLIALVLFGRTRRTVKLTYTICTKDATQQLRRRLVVNACAVLVGILIVLGYAINVARTSTEAKPFYFLLASSLAACWVYLPLVNWIRLKADGGLRLAADGLGHTYIDGISAQAMKTLGQIGVPCLNETSPSSFLSRPGFPVARFWTWFYIPLFTLGLALGVIGVLTTLSAKVTASRAIATIAHRPETRPGYFHSAPGLELWVPGGWYLREGKQEEPVPLREYRLERLDDLYFAVTVFPADVFPEFAKDDANGVRMMAEEAQTLVTSGFTASAAVAATLHGRPARRLDASGFIQPDEKGKGAVPVTFIMLQQSNAEWVYRVSMVLPSEWVEILGPQGITDMLEWVKPKEGSAEKNTDDANQAE